MSYVIVLFVENLEILLDLFKTHIVFLIGLILFPYQFEVVLLYLVLCEYLLLNVRLHVILSCLFLLNGFLVLSFHLYYVFGEGLDLFFLGRFVSVL